MEIPGAPGKATRRITDSLMPAAMSPGFVGTALISRGPGGRRS